MRRCIRFLALVAIGACVHHPANPNVRVSGEGIRLGDPPPPVLPTRFGAECEGVVAPAVTRGDTAYHAARHLIVMPPFDVPRSMRGTTIRIRMRYAATGVVDSIQVLDAVDEGYAKRYVEELRRSTEQARRHGRVHPAVYKGCAVDSWFMAHTTFPD